MGTRVLSKRSKVKARIIKSRREIERDGAQWGNREKVSEGDRE